jgi:hypothetical protein
MTTKKTNTKKETILKQPMYKPAPAPTHIIDKATMLIFAKAKRGAFLEEPSLDIIGELELTNVTPSELKAIRNYLYLSKTEIRRMC